MRKIYRLSGLENKANLFRIACCVLCTAKSKFVKLSQRKDKPNVTEWDYLLYTEVMADGWLQLNARIIVP